MLKDSPTNQAIPAKNNKEKTDSKKNINWEDVGEEFKLAMYNLASRIKENLEPNKKKKNKAKKS
jgi:hypothetical protein